MLFRSRWFYHASAVFAVIAVCAGLMGSVLLVRTSLAQSEAPLGAEAEPNDSFGMADFIAASGQVQATIQPRGDADWFAFVVDKPGELQVTATNVPADMDIAFRAWNGNKDVISDWFRPLAKGGDAQGVIDLPAAGRYYLEVGDGGGDAESDDPYSLNLTFTPAVDAGEPNNAFGVATPLALGQPFAANILPGGDGDWYAVDVDHQGELQVAITGVPQEMDVDYRVWNGNKDVISDWFRPLAKGGDTQGAVDLPEAGRYYLEVAAGDGSQRSVQPYTIAATFTAAGDQSEPNNSFLDAAVLLFDQPLPANILPRGDYDWFKINVDHHGELQIDITEVPADMAVDFRVWNANKDVLSDWFRPLAKGGATQGIFDLPAPGDYYLEVAADDGNQRSVQPFKILAHFTPAVDALEPNNNFGTATAFGLDRQAQINILPRGDADWFYFDVPQLGAATITASKVPAELEIVFRVWNANKDVVSDWFRPLAAGGDTTGVVDLAPGRYYLELAENNGDARSVQPFTLATGFVAAVDAPDENGTLASATPIELDKTIVGNILPRGDADWYVVEIPVTGTLYTAITNVAPELDMVYRVWNAQESVIADWVVPEGLGKNTLGSATIAEPGRFFIEVRDSYDDARSSQPYWLLASMSEIDPAQVPAPAAAAPAPAAPAPGATGEGAPGVTPEITPTVPLTETGAPQLPGVKIRTSAQIGPLGGELFVQGTGDPAVDGARFKVLPGAVAELTTVNIGTFVSPTVGMPFGLNPAGVYWSLTPPGLQFGQPATITLPLPPGAAEDAQFFIGHWNGTNWEDLGGSIDRGTISAAVGSFSEFGVFCGSLKDYRPVTVVSSSSSPEIIVTYIGGPAPDPANPTPDSRANCPPPFSGGWSSTLAPNDVAQMLLAPGTYHFAVSYPQPQPGVANSLWLTIKPGEGPQTITITDEGATSDDPNTQIDFPGKAATATSNNRPQVACTATVPEGVALVSLDPGAPALPSRVVQVGPVKLEQLPPKGPGVKFAATATDPEGSQLRPFWTLREFGSLPIAGDPVASGATFGDDIQFQPTKAGTYHVFATVYDEFGLFDECRWDVIVEANAAAQIDVFSGRTHVEFGRLDSERTAGAGPIPAVPIAPTTGAALPLLLPVPSLVTPTATVNVVNSTFCPVAVLGPFAQLPEAATLIGGPAPVDTMLPPAGADATNRWPFPGRTCVWAALADADLDPVQARWEFPSPYFGDGTFYAAIAVPAGFHPDAPEGIALGTLLTTNQQLNAYNALVTALYNTFGISPMVLWEAWDDPCLPGPQNPCDSPLSRGGVTNVVGHVTDGYSAEALGYAPIGVGPEGFQAGCDNVFFISSLTPNPSDPGPDQDVLVTARLSPVTEACTVSFSIVGTDGFARTADIATNKDGEATFSIPGGAEGVVDVVTAEVDTGAGTLEMEVTYTF